MAVIRWNLLYASFGVSRAGHEGLVSRLPELRKGGSGGRGLLFKTEEAASRRGLRETKSVRPAEWRLPLRRSSSRELRTRSLL